MADKIRIGIIGGGGIARGAHIPGYQKLAAVEIVAVADVAPGKAEETAGLCGIPAAYTDYNEMLAAEGLDAVSVCTPNAFHKAPTIAALKAGCHVLCEKPIAMNLQEGQEMVEAAYKAGKTLQIGLNQRFSPDAQALKRFIDAGELGDIYYGEATFLRRRGIPTWGVFTQKEQQGGGALIDIGVHALDHCLWQMGNPKPVSVTGVTWANFGKRTDLATVRGLWDVDKFNVDDMGVALVRFGNGACLILKASWDGHISESFMEARILGTHGGAHLRPLAIFKDMHGSMVDITPRQLPQVDSHHVEIEHFIAVIKGEAQEIVKPEQVLDVQAILDGIYESGQTGREVRLD
jgi:predicted dehydrogenase